MESSKRARSDSGPIGKKRKRMDFSQRRVPATGASEKSVEVVVQTTNVVAVSTSTSESGAAAVVSDLSESPVNDTRSTINPFGPSAGHIFHWGRLYKTAHSLETALTRGEKQGNYIAI